MAVLLLRRTKHRQLMMACPIAPHRPVWLILFYLPKKYHKNYWRLPKLLMAMAIIMVMVMALMQKICPCRMKKFLSISFLYYASVREPILPITNKPPYAAEYYAAWLLIKMKSLRLILNIYGKINQSRMYFTRTC